MASLQKITALVTLLVVLSGFEAYYIPNENDYSVVHEEECETHHAKLNDDPEHCVNFDWGSKRDVEVNWEKYVKEVDGKRPTKGNFEEEYYTKNENTRGANENDETSEQPKKKITRTVKENGCKKKSASKGGRYKLKINKY